MVEVDGAIVSQAILYRRRVHIGATPVPTGGVGAVSTDPDYRGRGHAAVLIG